MNLQKFLILHADIPFNFLAKTHCTFSICSFLCATGHFESSMCHKENVGTEILRLKLASVRLNCRQTTRQQVGLESFPDGSGH